MIKIYNSDFNNILFIYLYLLIMEKFLWDLKLKMQF